MKFDLREQIINLPPTNGVYLFKDKAGKVIYAGKAVDLKRRVASYFNRQADDPKIIKMLALITSLEVRQTNTEIEALLLEAELIKKFRPVFNVRLKDDTAYSYLRVTEEDFPTVEKARTKYLPGVYFGPYPLGNVTQVLRDLRKFFPFRDCTKNKFDLFRKLNRPCLYGDLDLCPAPCVFKIDSETYKIQIHSIREFLKGQRRGLISVLKREMGKASKKMDYEKALFFKRQINRLNFLLPVVSPKAKPDNLDLVILSRKNGMKQLSTLIGLSEQLPQRIEAYDISNLGGKYATGSMVVLTEGKIDKNSYRRFRIRSPNTPNDYRMMAEVLKRRLTNPGLGPYPNLILLDGGPGQLSVAVKVQRGLGLDIPIAALAKKREEVYLPSKSSRPFRKITLSESSPALQILQKIRDEAHRFALSYHRLLRKKGLIEKL